MSENIEKILLVSLLYYRWKRRTKSRRMWIHPIVEVRSEKGHLYNLFLEIRNDEEEFYRFTRMSKNSFYELLIILKEKITKKNTRMRTCISPEEKLVITLRYLASGCCLTDLRNNFRVGRSIAGIIVKDVCEAMWICLANVTIPQLSTERWLQIAKEFETYARFPNCIGAIDGKHIRITQSFNSGSMYYNYKHFFSTVIFAVCDANYCFTYVELGSYGKSSDSGIFNNSKLFENMCNGLLNIPAPCSFENSTQEYPYVIVGDDAFLLSENLLKPYGGNNLTPIKQNFNKRLSTARRYIECTFGILSNKWRIFHRPIDVNVSMVESIIKAACVLHNFVRTRDGIKMHNEGTDECHLPTVSGDMNHRGNLKALSGRDKFANYFWKNQ